ncbi:MAG: uroporphyrinogen decarboxylase family protein, partial [Anaerolineae bacterium]
PVDRPAVSFYEINGLDERPDDPDPFNIYSHPSWAPLIELAREKSDRIVMRPVPLRGAPADPPAECTTVETWTDGASRYTRRTIRCGRRTFTATDRQDRDVNTTWRIEHFLKSPDDLRAWLELPAPAFAGEPDVTGVLAAEAALGDSGIVMIDTPDPLCLAADLFSMADYTVVAATEPALFHRLLERFAAFLWPKTEAVAAAAPGRLWRIYGPEYASVPYLHPRFFQEYVVRYDAPMVRAIRRTGGYARIHCHGRLKAILDGIAATGCDGLDPIEPPPQGDVELRDVREKYGRQMVLFGNLEASDLENLPPAEFEVKIRRALAEGTAGPGRGFVLMPSSCPYGRVLSPLALANYAKMIEIAEEWNDS